MNALYVEAASAYKWCDFGFSKKIKEVQSLASQSASIGPETGTLFWMAPELFSTEVHIGARILVDCPPLVFTISLFRGGGRKPPICSLLASLCGKFSQATRPTTRMPDHREN